VVRLSHFADVSIPDWIQVGTSTLILDTCHPAIGCSRHPRTYLTVTAVQYAGRLLQPVGSIS
jgi:hypothetical protein